MTPGLIFYGVLVGAAVAVALYLNHFDIRRKGGY